MKAKAISLGGLMLGVALTAASAMVPAYAGAVREAAQFTDFTLARNDDLSTGLVNTGFSYNFFGVSGNRLYVNNNGNVTFTQSLGTFTPFGLLTSSFPIIAPFFADVDTRGAASGVTQYGTGTVDGRNAFGVNWIDVGYFGSHTDKLNSFQLIMVDRSDTGSGNFDFEFNYDRILWETGDASGGSNGFGGESARAGWTNGGERDYEFVGSGVDGALLDGGSNALISGSLNSGGVLGRYVFNVRDGIVIDPPPVTGVPEPASLALMAAALGLAGISRRRR